MKFMGMTAIQVLDHADDGLGLLGSYIGRVSTFD